MIDNKWAAIITLWTTASLIFSLPQLFATVGYPMYLLYAVLCRLIGLLMGLIAAVMVYLD